MTISIDQLGIGDIVEIKYRVWRKMDNGGEDIVERWVSAHICRRDSGLRPGNDPRVATTFSFRQPVGTEPGNSACDCNSWPEASNSFSGGAHQGDVQVFKKSQPWRCSPLLGALSNTAEQSQQIEGNST